MVGGVCKTRLMERRGHFRTSFTEGRENERAKGGVDLDYQRLSKLHAYNGWNLLFLVVTGIILYMPGLRGALAPVRVPLKYLHIASGVASVLLLALYLPLAREHWERLRKRVGQKWNVLLLVGLLIGWGLTGVALWFNRYMPAGLAEWSLVWHDRLTWFAIPWMAAHAVTRYYKIKLVSVTEPVMEDRRVLLAGGAAAAFALVWGGLGRALGLPGFEKAATPAGRFANGHERIPEGAAFNPTPVSVPPEGGGAKGRFRIYSVTDENPKFDARTWTFEVKGLIERPRTYTWEEFLQLPRTVQVSDFHCVTGWSVYQCTWEGVLLPDLLKLAGVKPEATYVKFYSGDGVYTDAVPLSVAQRNDSIIPYVMDGSPLPTPLGGPVRLIIPDMYAYKSVKWLQGIELIAEPHQGYWEELGYPSDAWVQKQKL